MKKILFLKARTGMDDPSPPMAFSYLGAIAKQKGFKVIVENLNAQYNLLKNEDIIKLIQKEKPVIVGVHIFTNCAKESYNLIKEIKPFCELIIVGGPHPTVCPEETIENGADIAFVGEAEKSFQQFLDFFLSKNSLEKIKGIVFKKGGKIIKTKQAEIINNLDEIPLPDKEVHKKSDYIKIKKEINNFGQILSTRGCPGRCTYCFSLFSKCYRYKSAKKVYEEILSLNKDYGITIINFIDDAFTINKQRMLEICELLICKKIPIEWTCATRIDFLDEEMIIKMKLAGCTMINFGIESFLPKTLLKMKKTGNPQWYTDHASKLLICCYKNGIRVGVNILTGFPWETAEDMKKMQKHIDRIKPYVTSGFYGGILQPQPGTEMYEKYSKEYGFEKWWLNKRSIFEENSYRPFFTTYYHPYWDHLENNFFNFNKDVFREIDVLYRQMGKWNLHILARRRFKNKLLIHLVYRIVFMLSIFSLLLYGFSPKLERFLMGKIKKFSYRFKFRKGSI